MNMFKDVHEFKPLLVEIEDRPLNPIGRSLLWIIVAIFVVGLSWLYFSKIDIIVSAQSKFIPTGEIKIYQAIERGFLDEVYVKEGELVKKGDPLFKINNDVRANLLEGKKAEHSKKALSLTRFCFYLMRSMY